MEIYCQYCDGLIPVDETAAYKRFGNSFIAWHLDCKDKDPDLNPDDKVTVNIGK